MKKHNMFRMVLACVIPLLVILLLPVLGIKSDYTAFIFIILMFAAHLFMMGGHGHEHVGEKKGKEKGQKHGHH